MATVSLSWRVSEAPATLPIMRFWAESGRCTVRRRTSLAESTKIREMRNEEHLNGSTTAIVVGAGIFGLTLRSNFAIAGYAVTLLNAGPVPHPLAASTDISKVVRIEYGRTRCISPCGRSARGLACLEPRSVSRAAVSRNWCDVSDPRTDATWWVRIRKLSDADRARPRTRTAHLAEIQQRFPAWNSRPLCRWLLQPKGRLRRKREGGRVSLPRSLESAESRLPPSRKVNRNQSAKTEAR